MQSTLLHPAQYEIFIDQVLDPASPHYNIGLTLKLTGLAKIEKLQSALTDTVNQFEVLKQRFDINDLEPTAYLFDNPLSIPLAFIDFSASLNAGSEANLWMQQRFNLPFALQKDIPLYEFAILCINPLEHWFFCRFHHLLIDGFGLKIFIEQFSNNYKTLISGESSN